MNTWQVSLIKLKLLFQSFNILLQVPFFGQVFEKTPTSKLLHQVFNGVTLKNLLNLLTSKYSKKVSISFFKYSSPIINLLEQIYNLLPAEMKGQNRFLGRHFFAFCRNPAKEKLELKKLSNKSFISNRANWFFRKKCRTFNLLK